MLKRNLLVICILVFIATLSMAAIPTSISVYTQKPNDQDAVYFTPVNFNIQPDGKMDVSDALQAAINQVKTEKSFEILFIPEGKYLISKTIYIPGSIRLIGYGGNRQIQCYLCSPGGNLLSPNSLFLLFLNYLTISESLLIFQVVIFIIPNP